MFTKNVKLFEEKIKTQLQHHVIDNQILKNKIYYKQEKIKEKIITKSKLILQIRIKIKSQKNYNINFDYFTAKIYNNLQCLSCNLYLDYIYNKYTKQFTISLTNTITRQEFFFK